MGVTTISNLNGGINIKADPSAIAEDGMVECVGFDLTIEGALHTAGGIAANDISTYLPGGEVQCLNIAYIGLDRYILATTTVGLYANGVLVHATFTGRFKCVGYLTNIYLVNGTLALRFDGTTCYQWGIAAPTTMPTIGPGSYLTKPIDMFEDLTDWIANVTYCTASAEAVIIEQGTKSLKLIVPAATMGGSYIDYGTNIDLTTFSNGRTSTESDYISFWLYVGDYTYVDNITLTFNIGTSLTWQNAFFYKLAAPTTSSGLQSLGFGASYNQLAGDTIDYLTISDSPTSTGYFDSSGNWVAGTQSTSKKTKVLTSNSGASAVQPTTTDQTLTYWTKSDIFQTQSGVWKNFKIPKNLFQQMGDTSKDWSTVNGLEIRVRTLGPPGSTATTVYIDDLRLVGGSDFVGYYWFMYSWARMDADKNIVAESGASRANKQFNISGPFFFDRHPLQYSGRPLSTDPQVNAGLISSIGGALDEFYIVATIEDNTTTADILYDVGEQYIDRTLCSKDSDPAPAGTDLVIHQNKIWMVGTTDFPKGFRSSDILKDGTFAPEAWPTRNGYEPEDNNGTLTNIRLVNKIPVVRGSSGEWAIAVLDPVDFLQVKARKLTHMGLIGQDAVVDFESSNIYPTLNGFLESDGNTVRFILPEVQPIISTQMSSAKGINAGLISYFTYTSPTTGDRTAKVDLFRGKPRFSHINDVLFEWLEYDDIGNKVYGIKDGVVYLLDYGYVNETVSGKELTLFIESRAYRLGTNNSWNRLELIHNTGGTWWLLYVYIDGVLKSTTPFKSTTRTTTNFRDFGPTAGYDFQFMVKSSTTKPGQIYFPIRIFHGGH